MIGLTFLYIWTQPDNKTLAKFGTIGFVRFKCIKSRSFVAFEAAFHDEIYNLVPGGANLPPPGLDRVKSYLFLSVTVVSSD